jgi:hypothetical protein
MQGNPRSRQLQFQQRDITRALRGARAAGYEDVRIEIRPDGTMIITTGMMAEAGPRRNPFDDVL